ncbi:MAG: hypothetical protein ABJP79_17960 [Tateyamaria sp.]|uniref:tetratricopeptide repeat protein n=1 Tax=Tateyamaria sp. TaxID=1929288 RepID=UPI00329ECF93
MKSMILAGFFVFLMASASLAQDEAKRFRDARDLEATNAAEAFAAMSTLADLDFPPAMDRMGYLYRNGIGTEVDLQKAKAWLERAVEAEHPWSFANLARVELQLGNGDAALVLLDAAVANDRPGTHRLLATSHIDKTLGADSDPDVGRAMLIEMAAKGDDNAARDLVLRYNWNRLNGEAPDAVVVQVEDVGLAGDPQFAEAALVYLTRLNSTSLETIQRRAALANVPNIRDRVLSVERIRLARDLHPETFWLEFESIMASSETENYGRAATTGFWINKNAWVRVMQMELRTLGYYHGTINARLTSRTISAHNRFCRDSGIWGICATGPLRGPTVRAVAEAIAERKK